jgi:hypothetical protein
LRTRELGAVSEHGDGMGMKSGLVWDGPYVVQLRDKLDSFTDMTGYIDIIQTAKEKNKSKSQFC